MKKVLLKGPVFTITGYGSHARQVYEFLSKVKSYKVDILNTNWGINRNDLDENDDLYHEMKKKEVKSVNKKYDISYQVLTPCEWDISIAKKNVGVTAGIESTFCVESWLKHINKMDSIIVTSQHAKESFLNSFHKFKKKLKTDINVIGLYATSEFYSLPDPIEFDFFDKITTDDVYLTIGQMTHVDLNLDRKNIIKTINSLNKYYKKINKNCTLILKTNIMTNSYRLKSNFKTFLKENVFNDFKNVKIVLVSGDLTSKELYSLYKYKNLKAFILLTKGECFGIPLLQSALCKIPIIATNWSSHKEYLNDLFYKVEYVLKEQSNSNKYFHEKSCMAEYIEQSFFNQLSLLESEVLDLEALRDIIINEFNKDVMFKLYKKVANKL